MSTLDSIAALVSMAGDDAYGNDSVIVTQAQYDILFDDANRTETVRPTIYRPDGTVARRGARLGVAAFLGSAVLVREVGASIVDVTGIVLDLREP